MRTTLPELWLSYLKELDPIAGGPTKIPCIGGFAVTQHYGSAVQRPSQTQPARPIDACAYVDVSNSLDARGAAAAGVRLYQD